MDFPISLEEFTDLGRGTHLAEGFNAPKGEGAIYVSTHYDVGVSELLHYHDEPHLTLVVNGGVVDKRKNSDIERFSGELMFFHSGEPHQTINKSFPTKYVSLTLDKKFCGKNSMTEAKLEAVITKNPKAKFTVLRIYKELSANDEFSDPSIEMLLLNLIDDKRIVKNQRPVWIDKIHQLLNDNWNKEISLIDLAIVANVHPKTLSRYFPKYFACTLGEYRRQLRIEKSLALIKNSRLSLTEIAQECNFFDQSHFIRNFKELTGFLPKQFQKL